jgi:alkanesulfonate monooxygenase SsuD/methylene tetrahydromethanopterin reductase-like flavin-dependent oxidoreductase (luciferase family)
MKFGISIPPFGEFGDARFLASIAREAEDLGWDGFFLWDHVVFDPTFHPIVDPWVALTAMALNTQRIRLGTLVTPVARRRPWKLARETVSLDHVSGGRLVLGVGLGDPVQWDYGFFGEEQDAKVRAKKLDEGLDILKGLWTAEPFSYQGEHYHLAEMIFRPRPVQSPRIPIWVGGTWDKKAPMRRAARWDGYMPLKWREILTPDEWRAILAYIKQHRTSDTPFDAVHGGSTPGDDPAQAAAIVRPYVDAGITWWIENVDPWRYGWKWEDPLTPTATALMTERIRQGPPKL